VPRRFLQLLALSLALACHTRHAPPPTEREEAAPEPDRLKASERLPEAETAFGLAIPNGLRRSRYFNDSVYFMGATSQAQVLDQIASQVVSGPAEMFGKRAVLRRAYVKSDAHRRTLHIEVTDTAHGTELYIQDVTREPAPVGLSQPEMWSRAGRNADGTPIDQNQMH
jgi:hypothetical protein